MKVPLSRSLPPQTFHNLPPPRQQTRPRMIRLMCRYVSRRRNGSIGKAKPVSGVGDVPGSLC